MAIDSHGNVIVTGESYTSLGSMVDLVTLKYSTAGNPLWTRRYDGPAIDTDMGFFTAVDKADNVYVSGLCLGGATAAEDFVTIKYAP